MKKINVLFVINDFSVGGAQRLIASIVGRLNKSEFGCSILTLFQLDDRADMYDLIPREMPVTRLSFSGFADVRSWKALIQALRKTHPDVVVTNLFFSNTALRLLKPFFRYRVISSEHNTYVHKKWYERALDRTLAHITYKIIAVSQSVKTFTARQEHIPEFKFSVINNGIEVEALEKEGSKLDQSMLKDELGFGADRKLIVSVGRLTTQKNHALLIEGFAIFAQECPRYDLMVVGEGALRKKLEDMAQKLGIGKRVFFFGNRADVVRFYRASEFFVSTSSIEGFGIAHAEALACGLPLLSTKTAGPDEMIEEGKNGFFFTSETPEGVAEGLARMAQVPPDSLRKNAHETARRYGIQSTVRAYEALIRSAAL